jgi:hypothetical protein
VRLQPDHRFVFHTTRPVLPQPQVGEH